MTAFDKAWCILKYESEGQLARRIAEGHYKPASMEERQAYWNELNEKRIERNKNLGLKPPTMDTQPTAFASVPRPIMAEDWLPELDDYLEEPE
jgi:hypothetical protein